MNSSRSENINKTKYGLLSAHTDLSIVDISLATIDHPDDAKFDRNHATTKHVYRICPVVHYVELGHDR